jgi:hypothetical protein
MVSKDYNTILSVYFHEMTIIGRICVQETQFKTWRILSVGRLTRTTKFGDTSPHSRLVGPGKDRNLQCYPWHFGIFGSFGGWWYMLWTVSSLSQ